MILVRIYDNIGMTEGFQISRHWRLNGPRYRLEGVRYMNGEVRLQAKHIIDALAKDAAKPVQVRVPVTIGK